jgi:class 3 adenylate cyclase
MVSKYHIQISEKINGSDNRPLSVVMGGLQAALTRFYGKTSQAPRKMRRELFNLSVHSPANQGGWSVAPGEGSLNTVFPCEAALGQTEENHCLEIAHLALAMMELMPTLEAAANHNLKIRIGLHFGRCVGGVIG